MSLASLCNTCWMVSCYREAMAYARESHDVEATQSRLLLRTVRREQDTWFGRNHRFASIRSVHDFQNAVPLSDYDDYRPAIERLSNGEQHVLTAERVRLFEPTGGSTSGEKLIPYTDALRASFQRAIRVWIWDLYSQRPAVRRGRSYWSITPLVQSDRWTQAGIPIGFEEDSAYLSRIEQSLVARTMAVPAEIAQSPSVASAQYATLFYLLRAEDLSLISVWSPTFLTELLRILWMQRESFCDDIAVGRISCNAGSNPTRLFRRQHRALVARADFLRHAFRNADQISQCVRLIWPSLMLVSCWADGPSLSFANHLQDQLPGTIEIQPKGLLATEAFVTIPRLQSPAPALAFRSHFFEFQLADNVRDELALHPVLAHELELGRRYWVVVTNGGGLYRYRLHDEVEVVGFNDQVPLLRFIGKTDDVSDLVGEKLDAAYVEAVIQRAFRELNSAPTFVQLRAERSHKPHYRLRIVIDGVERSPRFLERLARRVELGLNANPAYRYAREIGQLHPIAAEFLSQQEADLEVSGQIADRISEGKRSGVIKPRVLVHPSNGRM